MTKRWLLAGTAALAAAAAWPGTAGASGDYGCTPRWSLAISYYECAGTALISPRNDTRVNLALLLRDKGAARGGQSYPERDWDNADFGHVFVSWDVLQSAYWPKPQSTAAVDTDEPSYAGSRCQTLASGSQAFREALARGKGLSSAEREALAGARDLVKPACDGNRTPATWPTVESEAARGWLTYLQGAWAFYADDFATARTRYADLAKANDPWLAETARYMIARNELAAAQAGAIDEWGGFAGVDKVDKAAAERARAASQDYLSAYPRGRYAASADGLTRRATWLLGERPALARSYSLLLADPARSPAMLEEVESKLLFGIGMENQAEAPLLMATWDLLRMRQPDPAFPESEAPARLTQAELTAQAPAFARQPDLYGFLQASFAYHVDKDNRRVLQLIPDAPANGYTALAFSRQLLRGLALDALADGTTARFLTRLTQGARDLYQQPAAQLALAMHQERGGALDQVFAPGSRVTEPEIRTILLARVAPPALLRRQAGASAVARTERDVALFALLAKDLSRGRYREFGTDLAQVPATAPSAGYVGEGWSSGWMGSDPQYQAPLGLFRQGKWQEEYPCPTLASTAATLATNPRDVHARLCLAEFWRLNGFDEYLAATRPSADQLGGSPDLFPGKAAPRAALYASVLADRSAVPADAAYALYRSVMCYSPSGNNACGGEDVPVAQRKAWFQQLKRDHPTSRWAIDLKYYW
ncbi:hypothetical protein HNO88_001633 [Novosphingobium chloroacetimidivorans]|uniref:Outer membrane assembly lipoprotein YfiO n=1 Tax=Novosphingobium chloroacetimidivorans TaxID=1428314 RepID=A0A7W7K8P0_9SPHN|nr:hypothetical protein [Novosphingobium chloroacetimidivorans]MBB4858314.1 hypothetical protein [Novosphingobium chloroacetimidivorans]